MLLNYLFLHCFHLKNLEKLKWECYGGESLGDKGEVGRCFFKLGLLGVLLLRGI